MRELTYFEFIQLEPGTKVHCFTPNHAMAGCLIIKFSRRKGFKSVPHKVTIKHGKRVLKHDLSLMMTGLITYWVEE